MLVTVLAGLAAGFVHVFVWQPVAPYAIGALLASAAWWVYAMMLETGGIASKRSGITAEEWTADELRKLRREGWTVVNHVMLVHADVDHVVLGPGGFLAIETKFRSDCPRHSRGVTKTNVVSAIATPSGSFVRSR